jgi:hypothetical protein
MVQVNKFDSIIEQYLSANDKNASKKTLAFKYFNNDIAALDKYIEGHHTTYFKSENNKLPQVQLELSF